MYHLEVDSGIAERMMFAKTEIGYNYDDLSIILELEKSCVVRRFKGHVRFTAEDIAKFCMNTGVSLEWVIFGTGDMFKINKPVKITHRDVCWYCGGQLIWNSDFNYDEVYGEGDGIATFLTCTDCGAEVQYGLRTDESGE